MSGNLLTKRLNLFSQRLEFLLLGIFPFCRCTFGCSWILLCCSNAFGRLGARCFLPMMFSAVGALRLLTILLDMPLEAALLAGGVRGALPFGRPLAHLVCSSRALGLAAVAAL